MGDDAAGTADDAANGAGAGAEAGARGALAGVEGSDAATAGGIDTGAATGVVGSGAGAAGAGAGGVVGAGGRGSSVFRFSREDTGAFSPWEGATGKGARRIFSGGTGLNAGAVPAGGFGRLAARRLRSSGVRDWYSSHLAFFSSVGNLRASPKFRRACVRCSGVNSAQSVMRPCKVALSSPLIRLKLCANAIHLR